MNLATLLEQLSLKVGFPITYPQEDSTKFTTTVARGTTTITKVTPAEPTPDPVDPTPEPTDPETPTEP